MMNHMKESGNDRQTTVMPLYLVVALWGMRTRQLLTTETVAREFLIPQRNAGDILHYIEHEGCRFIRCERVAMADMAGRRGRRRALRILDVQVQAAPEEPLRCKPVASGVPEPSRRPRRVSDISKIRQWMVSRKLGEAVTPELLHAMKDAGETGR